jgi:hypothetical protein
VFTMRTCSCLIQNIEICVIYLLCVFSVYIKTRRSFSSISLLIFASNRECSRVLVRKINFCPPLLDKRSYACLDSRPLKSHGIFLVVLASTNNQARNLHSKYSPEICVCFMPWQGEGSAKIFPNCVCCHICLLRCILIRIRESTSL